MATNFAGVKALLDLPTWQATPLIYNAAYVAQTGIAGSTLACDKRASQFKQNLLWLLTSAASLLQYNTKGNGWVNLNSPALAGVFGTGACQVFCPSLGPRGTIAAGATTTTVTLSTALPAAVGPNQLAGARLRIVNNIAGGGQTTDRTVIANTSGTTPILTVDATFGYTPATGATYELLTGRLFMLCSGTTSAGIWKFFDIATNSFSGNLATTNLPATIGTGSAIVAMDELHTPITGVNGVAINGEVGGYFGNLTATGSSGTTLTGQAASGDAAVLANEYRNFQIRIVTDTSTPTAVGQRRRITSHTAGVSPVYTVPTWTVTPSANATYAIENNNDILLWTGTLATTYRYEPIGNTWDTTTYAAKPSVNAGGTTAFHTFGIVLNAAKSLRHSFIYNFRGGSTGTLDVFDIAGATTGSWNSAVPYQNQGLVTLATSSGSEYSVVDNKVMIVGSQSSGISSNMYVYDVDKNILLGYAPIPQTSTAGNDGDRLGIDYFVDGSDKKAFFYFLPSSQSYLLRSMFIGL